MLLRSEEETLAAGRDLAKTLRPGDVIALEGTLGAGKTHLTKGIAQGLHCPAEVSSPTFTLVHEYLGGDFPIFHFDFYRLDTAEEVLALGWDEYVEAEGICIVEWPGKFPELLPSRTQWWKLEHVGETVRELERIQP